MCLGNSIVYRKFTFISLTAPHVTIVQEKKKVQGQWGYSNRKPLINALIARCFNDLVFWVHLGKTGARKKPYISSFVISSTSVSRYCLKCTKSKICTYLQLLWGFQRNHGIWCPIEKPLNQMNLNSTSSEQQSTYLMIYLFSLAVIYSRLIKRRIGR